jgi:pimeloyl-ACP methyl ester carboxylesterase
MLRNDPQESVARAKLTDWAKASMRILPVCFAVAAWIAVAPAHAQADKMGVVLLHGKESRADQLADYAEALEKTGIVSESPEMCWSQSRIYDKVYLDCLMEIDDAVAKLRERGATSIVVLGMSLGGNAALAYGARREGLKGIIAIVPAPAPEFLSNAVPELNKSVRDARALVAAGKGDAKTELSDRNIGKPHFLVSTTPNIYLSFLAPDSPGVMPDNAAKLKTPLLIVSASFDSSQRSIPYVFARVPKHAMNRYVLFQTDHQGALKEGRNTVLQWLKELAD